MNGFDDALIAAVQAANQYAEANEVDVIVIRDLLGRNSLAVPKDDGQKLDRLRETLLKSCAPFVSPRPVLVLEELFAADLITNSPVRRPAPFTISGSARVSIIERSAVGADWLGEVATGPTRRVTLYGYKGGVGRSTAAYALAEHLAELGKVVLVIDLDLESPGVSTMLAPRNEDLPEHGLVDHLVEYAVGEPRPLTLVARAAGIVPESRNGEVWFAAAAGRLTAQEGLGDSYLDKLGRVYVDLPAAPDLGRDALPFGARLEAAVAEAERQVAAHGRPADVVLLDSRSGIHDIAAVAITQLSSLSLLFAGDNPQTWLGYRRLFARWATRLPADERVRVRGRLQMVASLVPMREEDAYLRKFADHAQSVFAETLYDDDEAAPEVGSEIDSAVEPFNFAPDDEIAPHYPIPIRHSSDLVGVIPGVDRRWQASGAAQLAYAKFFEKTAPLIEEAADAQHD